MVPLSGWRHCGPMGKLPRQRSLRSKMKAKEFDTRFDEGEDVIEFLDLSKAKRPSKSPRLQPEQSTGERAE